MTSLKTYQIPTPLGDLTLVLERETLVFLDFSDNLERMNRLLGRRFGSYSLEQMIHETEFSSRISEYFAGDFSALEGLSISTGGTEFQQKVWQALLEIPAGQTWSYGQLAEHLGSPRAVRAVGQTNGLNPIGLVLPCHRVIGANGTLTGYAGGLERKKWLLEHERNGVGALFSLGG